MKRALAQLTTYNLQLSTSYMRYFFLYLLFINSSIQAQQTNTYWFDFGVGKTTKGYIPITPSTIYNTQTGYGFHAGAELEAVDRGGNAPVTSDFITSRQ